MTTSTPVIEHPDFLLLDEELDADTLALRDRVRSFALHHVEPVINDPVSYTHLTLPTILLV